MAKHQLLITDHPWGDAELERALLGPAGVEVIEASSGDEDELARLAADADAIATCWARVTRRVLDAAPRCRHVARMGIGLDNIDVAAATGRGMIVTNIPDYCVDEVADHTLALMLSAIRNVGFFDRRIRDNEYGLRQAPPMHRLRGRTLGLVGFGRIAREVYRRARPFQFDIQATSPSGNDYGEGCRMVPLAELLQTSDVISLHAPLTDDSRHLISAEALRTMKSEAYLINTSRGGLIDQDALADALADGRLAGAALDVFDPEPPDLAHRLFRDERVTVTPHAAFVSVESLIELRQRVARQVLDALSGRTPENVVNS